MAENVPVTARRCGRARSAHDAPGRPAGHDDGFTLIELLIVSVILPLVMGSIAFAFIEVLSLRTSVSNNVLDSADAQTTSSNFEADVHSALQITTSAGAPQCLTATQRSMRPAPVLILGLRWGLDAQGNYQTTVSYVKVQQGTAYSLVRNYCVDGSTTAAASTVVAADVPGNLGAPTILPAGAATPAAAGYTNTAPGQGAAGVTSVTLSITSPGSNYHYTLAADPSTGVTNNQGGSPIPANTSCGFANPGTGTYASTLCFVDFSNFKTNGSPTSYCSISDCPAGNPGRAR